MRPHSKNMHGRDLSHQTMPLNVVVVGSLTPDCYGSVFKPAKQFRFLRYSPNLRFKLRTKAFRAGFLGLHAAQSKPDVSDRKSIAPQVKPLPQILLPMTAPSCRLASYSSIFRFRIVWPCVRGFQP